MKKNYTDINIVLDRSGSMDSVRSDTVGGVNAFIAEQQQVPGEATFSLFQFNDQFERSLVGIPIKDAPHLTDESYKPSGNTCLYGAIGRGIRQTGDRLKALPEDQRPEKVVFVIVTDGQENSSHLNEWSREHTAASIKADITRQRDTYKWQFVFIGADQDAIANASMMAMPTANAINYAKNKVGTEKLYGALSSNLRGMRMGVNTCMSWSADQIKEQAEAAKQQP